MRQYARQIDQALPPLLNGLELPLILAAAEPLDSIYRSAVLAVRGDDIPGKGSVAAIVRYAP